jgi:hypothetical protein
VNHGDHGKRSHAAERSGAGSVCDRVYFGCQAAGSRGNLESLGLELGDEAASLLLGVDAVGEVVADAVASASSMTFQDSSWGRAPSAAPMRPIRPPR